MKLTLLRHFVQQEDLNFLLTNRIPRIALTRFMGWFSPIRNPVISRLSIAVWRLFADVDLSDARNQHFASLHDCFIRELVDGARPVDFSDATLTSPCDAIVGACGAIENGQVYQAKGFPYAMRDLFGDTQDTTAFRDGLFVTLRLTSGMYHRFHAPHDCELDHVTFLSGDTWNVNPIALARVERLFCKNERAVLRMRLSKTQHPIAIVPVAAILVASLRLHCLEALLHGRYDGPTQIPCASHYEKGQELGWFQHGSTIIVFVPKGFRLSAGVQPGVRIQMGRKLFDLP